MFRLSARITKLCILVSLALATSGCWDYADLETRAPVLGMGLDRGDGTSRSVVVSAEVPIASAAASPSGGGVGEEARSAKVVFESRGETISEATEMLNEVIPREPILRQIAAVVVSREVAVQGIEPLLDYFLRNPLVNVRAQLWVTEQKAKDILAFEPQFQAFVAFGLDTALLKSRVFPAIPQGVTIENFSRKIGEGGVLVPRVELEQGRLHISGAGVFSAEARLVGLLDQRQTVGAAWFLGTLRRTEIVFPCPGDPEGAVAGAARPSGRRLEIEQKGDELAFHMLVSATLELTNLSGCVLEPWTSPEDRGRIAEAAARSIEKDIEAAVRRAKELGVDFLGLGLQLSRRRPALWRTLDWLTYFPNAPIAVSVSVDVDDPGAIHDGVIRNIRK